MSDGFDLLDHDTLRQRVLALEKDLQIAREEAQLHHGQHHSPEAHKRAEHAHHVSSFGAVLCTLCFNFY